MTDLNQLRSQTVSFYWRLSLNASLDLESNAQGTDNSTNHFFPLVALDSTDARAQEGLLADGTVDVDREIPDGEDLAPSSRATRDVSHLLVRSASRSACAISPTNPCLSFFRPLPPYSTLISPSHPHPRSILEHHDDGELMDDDHWDTQSTSRQQSAAAAAVQPSAKRQTRSTSKQPSASTSAPSARASSSHTRNRSTSAQPPLDSSKQPSSKCSTKRKPEAVVEEGEEEVDELAEEEEDNAAGAVEEQDGTGDDGQEEDDNVAPSPPRARKAARKISQPPNFDSLTSTSSASTSSPSSPSTANLHAAASNQRSQDDDAVMQMLSDAPDREEGEEDEDQTQQEEEEVDPDESLLIYARPFPAKKQTTLVPDSDGSSSNLARPPTLSPPLSPSSLSNEELAQSANRQARPPHATSSSSLRQPAESSDEHESETEIERLARIAKRAGKRRAIFPPSSRSQRLPSRSLSPPARTSRTTNSKLRSRSRSRSYRRRSPAPDEEEDDEAEDLEDDAPSGTPHSSAREIVSEKAKQRRNRGVKDKELLSLKVLSAEMGPDFGGGRGGLEEVVWGMLQRGYKLEDIVEKTRRVVCLSPFLVLSSESSF
jgi:hypothetical protein